MGLVLGVFMLVAHSEPPVVDRSVSTMFITRTLTNAYVFSNPMDLTGFDSVAVMITFPTTAAADVARIKPQWSVNGSDWVDEPVLDSGTITGLETRYTFTSRVLTLPMDSSSGAYIERSRRLARWIRYGAMSTNITTTATLNIQGVGMNNSN